MTETPDRKGGRELSTPKRVLLGVWLLIFAVAVFQTADAAGAVIAGAENAYPNQHQGLLASGVTLSLLAVNGIAFQLGRTKLAWVTLAAVLAALIWSFSLK